MPVALALAALVGAGAQLGAVRSGSSPDGALGTTWIIPAGSVLAMVQWLSFLPERAWMAAPLAAAVVVGMVYLQTVERRGPELFRGTAHATNIGIGFAFAFGAYAYAAGLPGLVMVATIWLASLAVALVVLRDNGVQTRASVQYAVVTAIAVAEVGWILQGAAPSLWIFAAVVLLALYATSGICHAILDRAPRRAYLEVLAVTIVSLSAVVIVGGRA